MNHPLAMLRNLGKRHLGTIHVGAHAGQEVEAYRQAGLLRAVLIEPLPDAFSRLKSAVGDDPRMIPIQALCSAETGVDCEFFISNDDGLSSSMLAANGILREAPHIEVLDRMLIASTALDDIIGDLEKTAPGFSMAEVDILTMDVRGAEFLVLLGATRTLQRTRYIFSAVSTGGLYEGDASIEQLQAFLKCFGFRLMQLALNKHGWGHALFIKSRW